MVFDDKKILKELEEAIASKEEPRVPQAEVAPTAPVAPVAKEPWAMTTEDIANISEVKAMRLQHSHESWELPQALFAKGKWGSATAEARRKSHRIDIRRALSEGKPVPANVLADYPDLVPTKPVAPTAGTVALSEHPTLAKYRGLMRDHPEKAARWLERVQNEQISSTLGRNFGESFEDYLKRDPIEKRRWDDLAIAKAEIEQFLAVPAEATLTKPIAPVAEQVAPPRGGMVPSRQAEAIRYTNFEQGQAIPPLDWAKGALTTHLLGQKSQAVTTPHLTRANFQAAVRILRDAAKQGDADAQRLLDELAGGVVRKEAVEDIATAPPPSVVRPRRPRAARAVAAEIGSKRLTHVSGLGAGQQEFEGLYLSTEAANRYTTLGGTLSEAKVSIRNPRVFDDAVEYGAFREGFLPAGVNIEEATGIQLRTAVHDATESLKAQGHDAVYLRESEDAEGILVVFDRSKVSLSNTRRVTQDVLAEERAIGRAAQTGKPVTPAPSPAARVAEEAAPAPFDKLRAGPGRTPRVRRTLPPQGALGAAPVEAAGVQPPSPAATSLEATTAREAARAQLDATLREVEEALKPPTPGRPLEAVAPPTTPPPDLPVGIASDVPDPDDVIKRFAAFIHSPESLKVSELTKQLRTQQLGQRVARFQARTDELVAGGMKFEDAVNQAMSETMTGAFDRPIGLLSRAMAEEFRDAAFAQVYKVLKDEPFEQMSTAEALRNALMGKGIPRTPGIAGKSAYTRLSRVFPPEILGVIGKERAVSPEIAKAMEQALATPPTPGAAARRKLERWAPLEIRGGSYPLEEAIEELIMGRQFPKVTWPKYPEPWLKGEQLGQKMAEFPPEPARLPDIRTVWEKELDLADFKAELRGEKRRVTTPVQLRLEPVLETIVKQPSLMSEMDQHILIRALKEIGWTTMDIGNALRAHKATFDASWWRQNALLIPNNKRDFLAANVEAWRGTVDKSYAEQALKKIMSDPDYAVYVEFAEKRGYDFLRPLDNKGVPGWRKEESFMGMGGERPIPRLMSKIPYVRLSQQNFVTGINSMNWRMFKRFLNATRKVEQKIASGGTVLKSGEAFSVGKEMESFSAMLSDMTGRANLGPLKALSPAMNAGFFSMRLNLGRLLTPRHLLSPSKRVRVEAWKNIISGVTTIGGVIWMGERMGLWDVETDRRSADFMKIRVGPMRVDPWGGYQQFAVFLSRLQTQQKKLTRTGQVVAADIFDTSSYFLRSKFSPAAGEAVDFYTGYNFAGEKVDIKNLRQWINRVAPLTPGDIYEGFEEIGILGAGIGATSFFGAGVGTYPYVPTEWEADISRYFAIPSNELDRIAYWKKLGKPDMTREKYRASNPEADAILFITGAVSSLQTPTMPNGYKSYASVQRALELIQEHGFTSDDIKAIKDRREERVKAAKMGRVLEENAVDILMRRLATEKQAPSAPKRGLQPVEFMPSGTPSPGGRSRLQPVEFMAPTPVGAR